MSETTPFTSRSKNETKNFFPIGFCPGQYRRAKLSLTMATIGALSSSRSDTSSPAMTGMPMAWKKPGVMNRRLMFWPPGVSAKPGTLTGQIPPRMTIGES